MKYYLSVSQRSEISARQEYLYDVFHLYFIPKAESDGFIPLVPFGASGISVVFVIGHADSVKQFLQKHVKEFEKCVVVLITCFPKRFQSLKKYHNDIYISQTENEYSYRYAGEDYGFSFDITKSELNFYNSKTSDVMRRIEETFQRL